MSISFLPGAAGCCAATSATMPSIRTSRVIAPQVQIVRAAPPPLRRRAAPRAGPRARTAWLRAGGPAPAPAPGRSVPRVPPARRYRPPISAGSARSRSPTAATIRAVPAPRARGRARPTRRGGPPAAGPSQRPRRPRPPLPAPRCSPPAPSLLVLVLVLGKRANQGVQGAAEPDQRSDDGEHAVGPGLLVQPLPDEHEDDERGRELEAEPCVAQRSRVRHGAKLRACEKFRKQTGQDATICGAWEYDVVTLATDMTPNPAPSPSPSPSPSPLPRPAAAPKGDIELLERLARARADLLAQVGRRIVGQRAVLDGILTAGVSCGA